MLFLSDVDKAQVILLSSGLAEQPESVQFGGSLVKVSCNTTLQRRPAFNQIATKPKSIYAINAAERLRLPRATTRFTRGLVTDTSGDIPAVEAMSIRLERAFMLAVSCGESEMK